MSPAVTLLPYQQRWFQDRSRFKLGRWSRQTGKTFTTTLEIVDDVHEAMTQGRRARWIILSRGERQAKEAMQGALIPHAKAYGAAIREIEGEFATAEGTTFRAVEVEFENGSRVSALPANPDTARGFSANVFLDEFAWHQDARAIWAALFPAVSAGHRLVVASTPRGKGNRFYELATDRSGRWSVHLVTIHDAVRDGLARDVAELRDALGDDQLWRQEYECEWLDEASAWLSFDLIDGCEHDDAGRPESFQGGSVYIGNDIARRHDLWVAWVIEIVGDVAWTREIATLRGATFAQQDAELDRLIENYNPVRVAMDQTGMGEKPVEDAQHRHGSMIEGVIFTGPRRLALATALRERLEDRTIRIPAGDRRLRDDLHAVGKTVGPTGAPRLIGGRSGDSHADRFWAAALAAGAAADGLPAFEATVTARRSAWDAELPMPGTPLHAIDHRNGIVRSAFANGLGRS